MLNVQKGNRPTEEIKTPLEEQVMPKLSGIRDWHCVTMGQIGSTERRPHLHVLLPLEEMRSRETKRITRQGGREGREGGASADRSSITEGGAIKVQGGLPWER